VCRATNPNIDMRCETHVIMRFRISMCKTSDIFDDIHGFMRISMVSLSILAARIQTLPVDCAASCSFINIPERSLEHLLDSPESKETWPHTLLYALYRAWNLVQEVPAY
jgi:hypothetical protein